MYGAVYFGSADDVPNVLEDARNRFFSTPSHPLHPLRPLPYTRMVNSLWFKWKSLRLPWRNMFLVGESSIRRRPLSIRLTWLVSLTRHALGQDLAGNTFWEFRATKDAARLRRIVKFDPRTHYADVKVTRKFGAEGRMRACFATASLRLLLTNKDVE